MPNLAIKQAEISVICPETTCLYFNNEDECVHGVPHRYVKGFCDGPCPDNNTVSLCVPVK